MRLVGMRGFGVVGLTVALLSAVLGGKADAAPPPSLTHALEQPYAAPELGGITDWINSAPLRLADWRGKVVLVDFWTYSCINCLRTLPYITAWYDKYHAQGLEIIGIHAPEFAFEKKLENVQKAVKRFGIHYPVALDNDLTSWGNFKNLYWPAHYLIDRQGRVVATHFGEGNYDVTENNIRALLGATEPAPLVAAASVSTPQQTPETYLGYGRAERNDNAGALHEDVVATYVFPTPLPLHHWALQGGWHAHGEFIQSMKIGAALRLHFSARKVFLVLGAATGTPITVHIMLNGKPVLNADGVDVKDGVLTVAHEMLYTLVDQGSAQDGMLEIQADAPGLQAYAFTFGN
jgi:thiol-disulfide isomerase/thioredoxin